MRPTFSVTWKKGTQRKGVIKVSYDFHACFHHSQWLKIAKTSHITITKHVLTLRTEIVLD